MTHANPLLGKWQSDEERTLQEVKKVVDMPKVARDLLENNFFGKLIFEFTETKIYSEFDENKSEDIYEVVRIKDDSVIIKVWSELLQEDEKITYHIEGETIYVITTKYNIREYFKRIN